MLEKKVLLGILMGIVTVGVSAAQNVPDHVTVAGGLTSIPLLLKAGEQFVSKAPQYKPPQALYNNTATGFKLFCASTAGETPNINTATRDIQPAEFESCNKNGVTEIVRFKLGHDALVAAQTPGSRFSELARKDIFLAVAKDIPDPKDNGKLIPNPYKTWKDINPALPDAKIQVLGPDPALGLYQTYLSAIILSGCREVSYFKGLEANNPKDFESACKNFRKDGFYSEYPRFTDAVADLKQAPDALSLLPLTVSLRENLKVLTLDKMQPTLVNVAQNKYALTFPLMVFIKKSHINLIPGFKEYLAELTSDDAIGTAGYLYNLGVIPLPLAERKQQRADVEALKLMTK
ncbi:MAG TPA: substrate-binding domain-containing protein [Candidatus Competibacter sp.]|nr:hypothetical protein [Candidatus Competibacteraceae bacterium]HRC72246.1 substrate-binding domain-containing protein [Candidatus Competibacter sp.]